MENKLPTDISTSESPHPSSTLPSDILFILWTRLDLKSFLYWISTNQSLHSLFKNNLRARFCEHILGPLFVLKPKNTNFDHPHKFWKEHIGTVWLYYYSLCHDKNVIFSFGEESSLSRYRVYVLTNVMIRLFPHYITNTRHKSTDYPNPGYEPDPYNGKTGTWNGKSYRTGPSFLRIKIHYINVFIKRKKHYPELQQIKFMKSEVLISDSSAIINYS